MRGITEESLRHVMKMHDMNDGKTSLIFSHLFNECTELTPWQPIESAPKDRQLLLGNEFYKCTGQWNKDINRWVDDGNRTMEPTHWQELPADPNR